MTQPRILVVFQTTEGQTGKITDRIAEELRGLDCDVEVHAADSAPSPDAYDAVVVGGSIHTGKYGAALVEFITSNVAALNAMKTALFQVSLTSANPDERHTADAHGMVEELARRHRLRSRSRRDVRRCCRLHEVRMGEASHHAFDRRRRRRRHRHCRTTTSTRTGTPSCTLLATSSTWPQAKPRLTERSSEQAVVRAAVDEDRGAGDEPGLLAAQERDHGAEVVGSPQPLCRNRIEVGRVAVELRHAVGGVDARQDRVHGHAVRGDRQWPSSSGIRGRPRARCWTG